MHELQNGGCKKSVEPFGKGSPVQAYGGVFPGSPPLDPDSYSKCYAMELDGFVSVSSTQNIQTSSTDNNTYHFANQFRYPGAHLHLLIPSKTLGGHLIVASHC